MIGIKTTILVVGLAFVASSAFAQGAAVGVGEINGGTTGASSIGSPVGGVGTTPSTTTGIGNGNNPGIGDRSDPSIRATPGLDANGPCNGARSTSGNNTPSC
jgi:hypothetical protein